MTLLFSEKGKKNLSQFLFLLLKQISQETNFDSFDWLNLPKKIMIQNRNLWQEHISILLPITYICMPSRENVYL